ncbi:uncharacterized protein TNCV_4581381 [Trichonephila clavipes]|nr:uncharacterized protein TNCV_4581381 [Trichonephila clavipes]
MPPIGGYHPYGLASILTGLDSNRACVGYAWPTKCSPLTPSHLSTGTSQGIDEWCNIPQDQFDNLILSRPRRLPSRHGGTLNSRRAASPLVGLVEGKEMWEALDHPQGVLPQNWGETELNRSVTCMVLKGTANDRRHQALCHDEFRGP